jgi:hypothetical protein
VTERRITNIAASIRARLQKNAKEAGRPFQEVLQYFAMERFLYRLSQSPHAEKLVLKGGLMLTVWRAPSTRPTRDIDFLAKMPNDVRRLRDFFDIWLLARQFDFDGPTLAQAVRRTFENRGTQVNAAPVALTSAFACHATKQAQWDAFLQKSRVDFAPAGLKDVVDSISPFLKPVALSVQREQEFNRVWQAPGPWR